jgi:hypothetical protein
MTRKKFGEGFSVVNDTNPFLLQDIKGDLILLFQRNVITSGMERTFIGISRFDLMNKSFSQDMFKDDDTVLLEYQHNSISGSDQAVNRNMKPTGLVLNNGTLVVMANDFFVYSNGSQEWSSLRIADDTIEEFFMGLYGSDVIDVGGEHIVFSADSILKLSDLNHTRWDVIPTSHSFDSPSAVMQNQKLHIAFEAPNPESMDDTDIHCFTSNENAVRDMFQEELLIGDASLGLGNERSFGNQTILYSKEGFLREGEKVNFVMAFESTWSENTDIWIMTSVDGRRWEGLLDITPTLEDELNPVLYSTNDRLFVIYKVGSKIGSKSSSDLQNWNANPEIPPIESEGQKYIQRDKNNHLFINETGVWYSQNFIYWKQAANLELENPSTVLIDQDNFIITSQNSTMPHPGIDIYHLEFKSNMESDNILPTLIIALLVIVIILILLAMILEVQR